MTRSRINSFTYIFIELSLGKVLIPQVTFRSVFVNVNSILNKEELEKSPWVWSRALCQLTLLWWPRVGPPPSILAPSPWGRAERLLWSHLLISGPRPHILAQGW